MSIYNQKITNAPDDANNLLINGKLVELINIIEERFSQVFFNFKTRKYYCFRKQKILQFLNKNLFALFKIYLK